MRSGEEHSSTFILFSSNFLHIDKKGAPMDQNITKTTRNININNFLLQNNDITTIDLYADFINYLLIKNRN